MRSGTLDFRVDAEIKRAQDEEARLDGKDLIPDTYVLSGDSSSEMVIRTYSDEVADVKIKVSDDFFDFGEF